MTTPPLTSVENSGNLSHVGRCGEGALWVRFRDKNGQPGKLYRYKDAAEHHDAILSAESPGTYLNAHVIKNKLKHPHTLIDEEQAA